MKHLAIRLIKNKKELKQIFRIRDIVFGKEQKIPRTLDFDDFDSIAKQIIVLYRGKPVGCARIRFVNGKGKLERIAILKKYRNKGFGKALTIYMINLCENKKVKEIYFHSQYYVRKFYKRLGFKERGKPFMEAGVKHIEMYMKVKIRSQKKTFKYAPNTK